MLDLDQSISNKSTTPKPSEKECTGISVKKLKRHDTRCVTKDISSDINNPQIRAQDFLFVNNESDFVDNGMTESLGNHMAVKYSNMEHATDKNIINSSENGGIHQKKIMNTKKIRFPSYKLAIDTNYNIFLRIYNLII